MENQYKKIIWSYRQGREKETLYLTPRDLVHIEKIYKKRSIRPETVDCVSVEFLLQYEKLSRYIIKELDLLLKINGYFEVIIMDSKSHSSYTRSRDQVKYEMSISTNGRYQLEKVERQLNNKVLKLYYKKIAPTLQQEDSIDRWSFGIVTNGKNTEKVHRLISSITQQNIPEYEILICGPFENKNQYPNIRILEDVVLINDIRAPLSTKKNKIIRAATYQNLCILHDRFSLPLTWYEQFRQYGNYFDFLCLPTVDTLGHRFTVDWMCFCEPITRTCTRNKSTQYTQWSTSQIIQGGVMVGKKHIISQCMLDERLHWEELEDIHFSKIAYLHGAFINIDTTNYFISDAVNHRATHYQGIYQKAKEWLSWLRGISSQFIKFHYIIHVYQSKKNDEN